MASVAQTFLSVRFEAMFEDYTGKNACATKKEFAHLFLTKSLQPPAKGAEIIGYRQHCIAAQHDCLRIFNVGAGDVSGNSCIEIERIENREFELQFVIQKALP